MKVLSLRKRMVGLGFYLQEAYENDDLPFLSPQSMATDCNIEREREREAEGAKGF